MGKTLMTKKMKQLENMLRKYFNWYCGKIWGRIYALCLCVQILTIEKYIISFRYVDRFIQPDESVSIECKEHLTAKPVFLPRSVRSYNLSPYGKARSAEAQVINNSDEIENHADVKHNSCTTVKDPLEKEK